VSKPHHVQFATQTKGQAPRVHRVPIIRLTRLSQPMLGSQFVTDGLPAAQLMSLRRSRVRWA